MLYDPKSKPFLVKVDVLTPITCPYESINGPPELPDAKND